MEQKTYEIIIEALVADLEMERWKLKEAEKKLEAEREKNTSLRVEIEVLKKSVEDGKI